jgi:hypothetical protein
MKKVLMYACFGAAAMVIPTVFIFSWFSGPVEIVNHKGVCMHQIEYSHFGREAKRVECFTYGPLSVRQKISFDVYYGK